MNFANLTNEELSSFFNMYSVLPVGDPYEYANELFNRIGNQGTFPESIIDLYIASQLKDKIKIPQNYNIDELNTNGFLELTRIFSLPLNDTSENKNRAKRILKMLTSHVNVIPVIFQGLNKYGDFNWMIQQDKYEDVLFLFNDNQEQFLAFLNGQPQGCSSGGGNAIIRPYQCKRTSKAAGIPTGVNGRGYTNLEQAKPYIDLAFERIIKLLNTGNYRRVMYSSSNDGRSLGVSIYSPSESIKQYIVNKIEQLRM